MSPSLAGHLLQIQSDDRLIALARHGHKRAFDALIQRYRNPLLAYAGRFSLSAVQAEDAVQQGLLQAWLALRQGTEVRAPRAWLYRIVHNTAVRMMRNGASDAELSDLIASPHTPYADLEQRLSAREALAGVAALPALQRDALLMTALAGHSHDYVGETLGVSETAVRGLVYRARTALRAGVSALTPWPLISWALRSRGDPSGLAQRMTGMGASAGGAGITGALAKGGVAAITAGALVLGAAVMRPERHHARTLTASATSDVHVSRGSARPEAVAPTASHPATVVSVRRPASVHRPAVDQPLDRFDRREAVRGVNSPADTGRTSKTTRFPMTTGGGNGGTPVSQPNDGASGPDGEGGSAAGGATGAGTSSSPDTSDQGTRAATGSVGSSSEESSSNTAAPSSADSTSADAAPGGAGSASHDEGGGATGPSGGATGPSIGETPAITAPGNVGGGGTD